MNRSHLKDQIVVYLGGIALVLFVILSWVPSGCPVVRRAILGCPTPSLPFQSDDQKELNRVPHQEITTSSVEVSAKGQDDRSQSRITFEYRAPAGTSAELSIQNGTSTVPLATVLNPVLEGLTWPVFTSHDPDVSLYTREATNVTTINDYLAQDPPKLVADRATARLYNLAATRYTPLDQISSLDGYSALLVAALPRKKDGTWTWFEQQFDLSAIPLDSTQHLKLIITNHRPDSAVPLLLGEVHIDYRK